MKYKEHQVIMLPTEDRTNIVKNIYCITEAHGNPLQYVPKMENSNNLIERGFEYQHLYIISDDEIKEGDWFYYYNKDGSRNGEFGISQLNKDYRKINSFICKKIIATTDKSLFYKWNTIDGIKTKSLLQPSQSFIEEYCKEGGTDEVLVEYINYYVTGNYTNTCILCKDIVHRTDKLGFICESCGLQPKVNSDNTINIIQNNKIKKEYESELKEAFEAGKNYGESFYNSYYDSNFFVKTNKEDRDFPEPDYDEWINGLLK